MKTRLMFSVCSLFFLFPYLSQAQKDLVYTALGISDTLKENAYAVVRWSEETFEVTAPGKATYHIRKVITILDKKSKEHDLVIHYNPSEKVGKIKAKIYDALGQEVKKVDSKDFKDYSAVSDFSIYEDDRIKHYNFFHTSYPFTIEYEYDKIYSGIQMYPSWHPQFYNTSVEKSAFTLLTPNNIAISQKSFNADFKAQESTSGEQKRFYWEATNLMAVEREEMAPHSIEVLPWLAISPHRFEVAGYTGSMATWKTFGQFMYQLNKDRDRLSPEMAAEIKNLTANAQSDSEKIAILYKYLQENTRYVSVQLGIGGWQTFDASYVEDHKYGDCKALTNFMKSMLQEVGINSYATLIRNGSDEFEIPRDFTLPFFNHVVLNVPDENIWLECTSNNYPPNYLGSRNADRNVLRITEKGGELIRTPKLTAKDNQLHTKASIELTPEGEAMISEQTKFTGYFHELYRYFANSLSEEDQRKRFLEYSPLPSFSIEEWAIEAATEKPEASRNCRLKVSKYASRVGKRFFVPLNSLHPFDDIPESLKERHTAITIEDAYTQIDEFDFEIPEDLEVESYPEEAISLQSEFGNYTMVVTVEGQKVHYSRQLEIKSGRFPADQYEALRDFYKEMAKKDAIKMVLNKKVIRP